MTATTVQALATEARGYFRQIERGDDTIWTLADDRPEWVRDMVYAAHDSGGMLPDDWRYAFIVEALDALEEHDDPDDIYMEADIYTADLTRWLGSRADRTGYVNDAMRDTETPFTSIVDALQLGQAAEKEEVLATVRGFLEDRIEARADADDETEE